MPGGLSHARRDAQQAFDATMRAALPRIEQARAEGYSWPAIAAMVGVKPKPMRRWMQDHALTQRACLRCDELFGSEGRWNRLCLDCLKILGEASYEESYRLCLGPQGVSFEV